MTTLVSNDGEVEVHLEDSVASDFGLLRYNPQQRVVVPASGKTLSAFNDIRDIELTPTQASELLSMLEFLKARYDTVAAWVTSFPVHYYTVMSEDQLRLLWEYKLDSLPMAYYRDRQYLLIRQIASHLEEVLVFKVSNLLYLSYLVQLRTESLGVSLMDYVMRLKSKSRLWRRTDVRASSIVPPPRTTAAAELFALLDGDPERKLLAKTIFTYEQGDDMQLYALKEYWTTTTDDTVLPQVLYLWSTISSHGDGMGIKQMTDSLREATESYRDKLLDLFVVKTTKYDGHLEWRRHHQTHDIISSLKLQGEAVLGAANARILLTCLTRPLSDGYINEYRDMYFIAPLREPKWHPSKDVVRVVPPKLSQSYHRRVKMATLVSSDGGYSMELDDDFLGELGLIKSLNEDFGNKYHTITLPSSSHTLKVFEEAADRELTKEEAAEMTELLYYLQASKEVVDSWLTSFPRDYHESVAEAYLRDLWATNREQEVLPDAVLLYDDNLQGAYEEIRNLLEETLGVEVPNLLYVSYLVDKRRGFLGVKEYLTNMRSRCGASRIIRMDDPDIMFRYEKVMVPGALVYQGAEEILALVREDRHHNLLPKSLFTRTPTELGMEATERMFETYWMHRASLDEVSRCAVLGQTTEVESLNKVLLPRLLRIWSLLADNGQVVTITDYYQSSIYRLMISYCTRLLDLLIAKRTKYSELREWLAYYTEVEPESEGFRRATQQELLTLLDLYGEATLGEANKLFLLNYTKAFPSDFLLPQVG